MVAETGKGSDHFRNIENHKKDIHEWNGERQECPVSHDVRDVFLMGLSLDDKNAGDALKRRCIGF